MREGLLLGRMLLPVLSVARRHGLDEAWLRRFDLTPARFAAVENMVSSFPPCSPWRA